MGTYKKVKQHTAGSGNGATSAGDFPNDLVTLSGQPSNDETLILKGVSSNPTVTLTFKSSSDTAADHRRLHNGINNTDVLIGNTLSDTYKNISTAINTNDSLTKIGADNTLSVTVSGDINSATGVLVWQNEKITGALAAAGGTSSPSRTTLTTGAAMVNAYDDYEVYNGIKRDGGGKTVNIIVRKATANADGYNIGPPVNQLEVKEIRLVQDQLLPIRTYGTGENVPVYRS